jgi:hypothetical protein
MKTSRLFRVMPSLIYVAVVSVSAFWLGGRIAGLTLMALAILFVCGLDKFIKSSSFKHLAVLVEAFREERKIREQQKQHKVFVAAFRCEPLRSSAGGKRVVQAIVSNTLAELRKANCKSRSLIGKASMANLRLDGVNQLFQSQIYYDSFEYDAARRAAEFFGYEV